MPLMAIAAADPDLILDEQAEFEEIIADLDDARQELVDGFDSLVDRFNEIWTGPIDWFRRTVFDRGEHQDQRDAIEQIRKDLFGDPEPNPDTQFTNDEGGEGTIYDLATKMFEHHTPVMSLFIMSSRWVTDTKSQTSNMFAHIWQPEDGRNLAGWRDEARSAYDDIVDQQKASVQALEDMASFMSSWLADIATDNVEYVTFLLGKLGEITNIIIESVGRLTNAGGATIVWEVARLVGAAIELAIDHLGTIANNIAAMVERLIKANDEVLLDFSSFPDGNWPEAVTRA
jgi:hypothetical protein